MVLGADFEYYFAALKYYLVDKLERITKDLYIGGITTKAAVKQNKIKSVISLIGVNLPYKAEKFPIHDGFTNNDPIMFLRIMQAIDKRVKTGRTPIFITCAMGMSRSPVICALYLHYNSNGGKYSNFDDALEFVLSKSIVARPNDEILRFVKYMAIPFIDSMRLVKRRINKTGKKKE